MKIACDTGLLIAAIKAVGEKHHQNALALISRISTQRHEAICSALVLEELRGGLLSSTRMPIERIWQSEISIQMELRPRILPFDDYIEKTKELLLEFRDIKRKRSVPTTDFHHLATAAQENADIFVTIDEKHFLNRECREAFSSHVAVLDPEEALKKLLGETLD